MVNAIEAFDAKHLKPAEEIPAFRPGDTVEVNVKIKEGNNSRLQAFTGVVIARQGGGVRETFVYYLRNLRGKAARIVERRDNSEK